MDERTRRRMLDAGIGKIQKNVRAKRYKCLVHDCERNAVASHSQQRENQLRSIARDGRVYALDRNLYGASKRQQDSPLSLRLQGIGSTSTFPGFCAPHDRDLFLRIDTESCGEHDPEQAWALFLRTFAYEFAQKRKAYDYHDGFQALLTRMGDGTARRHSQIQQAGINKMLSVDAPQYFRRLWTARERDGYPGLTHYQRLLPYNIGLSTSCMFSPLTGEPRQQGIMSEWQPLIAFNIVPRNDSTLIVASAMDEHAPLAQWIERDLHDDTTLEGLVHRCAFIESEDTCLKPELWEGLEPFVQSEVVRAMDHEMYRGPMQSMPRVVRIPP